MHDALTVFKASERKKHRNAITLHLPLLFFERSVFWHNLSFDNQHEREELATLWATFPELLPMFPLIKISPRHKTAATLMTESYPYHSVIPDPCANKHVNHVWFDAIEEKFSPSHYHGKSSLSIHSAFENKKEGDPYLIWGRSRLRTNFRLIRFAICNSTPPLPGALNFSIYLPGNRDGFHE